MRRTLLVGTLAAIAAAVAVAAPVAASPVPGAPACPMFPADNVWHSDISALPVHERSALWVASMNGATRRLHPDFGPSGEQMPYGIPYAVVDSSYAKVAVDFAYAGESDPGPYPLGPDTPIEGGADATGDRHALVVDRSTCRLYETWDTHYSASGSRAGSGAVFDLRSNALRPDGWTSADAAGLPVLAGLLRRDEVLAGNVDHAIRVTASRTDRSYVWPARHHAGAASDPALPPMGARFRLRANYDLTGLRADTQVVLRAMQRHGLILADNGSDWYFQGTAEQGWPAEFLAELKAVPASAFEAVDASSLMVHPDSGQARGAAVTPSVKPSPSWTHWAPRPRRSPSPALPGSIRVPPASPGHTATPAPRRVRPAVRRIAAVAAAPDPAPSLAGEWPAPPPRERDRRAMALGAALAAAGLLGGFATRRAATVRAPRRPAGPAGPTRR